MSESTEETTEETTVETVSDPPVVFPQPVEPVHITPDPVVPIKPDPVVPIVSESVEQISITPHPDIKTNSTATPFVVTPKTEPDDDIPTFGM